jgi:APA family basic amino acid/polyamine antiporter
MIGTGIFTSLGFQLQSIQDLGWILTLWIIGGIIAFTGSMAYAALGTALPENGGEVLYLSRLIHPVFGYISAWVSLVAGFAAPAAASALTASAYLGYFIPTSHTQVTASVILIFLTILHLKSISTSGSTQYFITSMKILVILVFIILSISFGDFSQLQSIHYFRQKPDINAYGVSLLYVFYTYSGWNAFGYFAGHVDKPRKNIVRIALLSVSIVFIIYFMLNVAFILAAPIEKISGNAEAGAVASSFLLGDFWGRILTSVLGMLLISSTSAFLFTGPRIFMTQHEKMRFPEIFRKKNSHDIPVYGMIIQLFIALLFVWFSKVDFILKYAGFSLSFFTLLSVFATFKLKHHYLSFKIPYSPLPQLLFIVIHFFVYLTSFKIIKYEIMVFLFIMIFGALLYSLSHSQLFKKTILLIFIIILTYCTDKPSTINQDTSNYPKKEIITKEKFNSDTNKSINQNPITCITHQNFNEWLDLISGIKQHQTKLTSSHVFKQYAERINKKWQILDSLKLNDMRNFSNQEIMPLVKDDYTLFYPFSGADFLYAHTFFPNAKKIVMCALEPLGSMPDLREFEKYEDSLREYLSQVENSLFAIMRFSFFKTKNMKTDFAEDELNGVIHIMSFFMKRSGFEIENIQYFIADSTGIQFTNERKKAGGIRFFICNNNLQKEVYYYRADLSNTGYKKHEKQLAVLLNHKPFVSFVKSASYLMHQSNFSHIRNFILKNSIVHVQDESGIPVRFIDPRTWNLQLYGEYRGPISLFKIFHQKDLDSLYKNTNVKKLGFGIGYNYKDKNSCFMIFKRK